MHPCLAFMTANEIPRQTKAVGADMGSADMAGCRSGLMEPRVLLEKTIPASPCGFLKKGQRDTGGRDGLRSNGNGILAGKAAEFERWFFHEISYSCNGYWLW